MVATTTTFPVVAGRRTLRFDPIAEAHRQWRERWPAAAEHMAAITSVMRAQQLVLSAVEGALKPFGLTFASYEALTLLSFTRHGSLPLGKMGERLMVHPTSITNTINRLEDRGLVRRVPDSDDGRRMLGEITPEGRRVAAAATEVLNEIEFGLGSLTEEQAVALSQVLRPIRLAAGDFQSTADDPWRKGGGR
jgi:DNA-binding MarR family transcriptional regulator